MLKEMAGLRAKATEGPWRVRTLPDGSVNVFGVERDDFIAVIGNAAIDCVREDADLIAASGGISPEAWSALAEALDALAAIRDMEPEPSTFEVPDHSDCAECKRWEGHPIQRGMCDDLHRALRAREHDRERRWHAQQHEMRDIARESLSKLDEVLPAPARTTHE